MEQPTSKLPDEPRRRRTSFLRTLGPGLITGAADDDPSGIATYSQVGAQFGYTLGWTIPFSYPLLVAIQGISAGIGAVTGQGIAQNLRRHYPPWVMRFAVLLLLVANFINIGADLAAMGAALRLLVGGSQLFYAIVFGLICASLEILISYRHYVMALKWLTLSLFAYVAVVLAVDVPWTTALRGAVIPQFAFDSDHAMALVAVLGTTISPYLFFWQAGEEVEELHRRHLARLATHTRAAGAELARIRTDTLFGMGFSHLIALFIIFATAATLHANGITQIETSAQAAEALRPIAGEFTFAIFAVGIIGTGMLAVPVLAGSAAYAVAEMFRWPEGLDRRPREAKAFYATIAVATLGSVVVSFTAFDPIRALYWAAVINGILAVPLMAIMVMMVSSPRVMGRLTAPRWMVLMGGLTVLVMALATIGFLVL
ncbi:divalent metal cation transporter [Nordella sp. HKS 07]|uniref:NRAMP family divalent metal transporter n=1 Tax=Nordella sp. HKS 07 TaxID=2712222 RepID=UPI0013E19CD2|nr:divalent metal cation transporter [Nordella sp. HKS 07]QIG51030.1 divalent metal cation transporter [Nordella sp. HKS 07]